ncbi:MAG: helix-turn-helix domain-containing protein [Candidatus Omnitrophica bacterium]|nr:helix-turn-helix domain-containing protein [Candidatus Omnitrophota bacterium]
MAGFSDEILTLEEASRFLKLSRSTLYNLAQRKRLPAHKVGKSWRFVRSNLIKWLSQGQG